MPKFTLDEFEKRLRKARTTGLGSTGIPRMGKPKTKSERKATHYRLYGTTELPARGYGLLKRKRKKRGIRIA